jgi:putative selenium metabolism protein SsnA
VNLLIRKARILQFFPEKYIDESDILIEDGLIIKVEKNIEINQEVIKIDKEIDASGKCVIPGNVCSHNHLYSVLARGILADIKPASDFVGILKNLWWRLDRALDQASLYYSGIVGSIEAVKAGTTAVIDHNASPSYINGSLNVIKEAYETCGLRGILCYEVTDRNGKPGRDMGIRENAEFIKYGETELLKGALGAHAPFTLSDDSLRRLSEAVEETNRGVHIHVAEDRYDPSYSHHHYGISPLERLDEFQLMDKNSLIIHGVHLIERDIEILNAHDSFLVSNPRSNMNNFVGYNTKIGTIKNVAIGTDGIGSDMFEEVKFGYFKNRDAGQNISPFDFMRYLCAGNRILGRYFGKQFGRIEPGFVADLVVLDYLNPTPMEERNVAGHFIFGISSLEVNTVIINGRCVYDNRRFPFETGPKYLEARREAQSLWKRMDALD